jgi:uncharacterized protein YlzI (FlbEa/FlbD family)
MTHSQISMIALTRQDGQQMEIKADWIGLVDPDGFGNGCWVSYNDGKKFCKIHVKESVTEVKLKMRVMDVEKL